MIIGVERKWKYLVEEDDEYVIHYNPVETWEFFSNLLSSGLIFILYSMLVFPENVTIGYIFLLSITKNWVLVGILLNMKMLKV